MDYLFELCRNLTVFLLICMTALIVADFITGVLKAIKNGELKSSKLREGLWNKLALFCSVPLAYIVSEVFSRIATGMPLLLEQIRTTAPWMMAEAGQVAIPGVEAACLYVIFTESVSIFENLCAINPQLANSPLASVLQVNNQPAEGKE